MAAPKLYAHALSLGGWLSLLGGEWSSLFVILKIKRWYGMWFEYFCSSSAVSGVAFLFCRHHVCSPTTTRLLLSPINQLSNFESNLNHHHPAMRAVVCTGTS